MESTKGLPGRRPYVAPEEKLIPHNFTIHPRHLERLRAEGRRRHVPLSVILREILDRWVDEPEGVVVSTPVPAERKPRTGKELLEEITKNGLVGMWEDRDDIGDSLEFAQKLREQAEKREWD